MKLGKAPPKAPGSLNFMSVKATSPLSQGLWKALCRHLNSLRKSGKAEACCGKSGEWWSRNLEPGRWPRSPRIAPWLPLEAQSGAETSNPALSLLAQMTFGPRNNFLWLFWILQLSWIQKPSSVPYQRGGDEAEAQTSAAKWEGETPTRNSGRRPVGANGKPGW